MKRLFARVFVALKFAVCLLTSAEANSVGFTRLVVDDPMGGDMQVSLWYPTNAPSDRIRLGPYTFEAARDAPPSPGQRGLVLISHGTEGSDLGHRNLGLELARQGLIAAAPLHPRDNFRDNSGVGQRVVMEGRPKQITAVIDALLAHPDWGPHINPDAIGAFGFSLGGYTILAALGAQPDMMRIADHCEHATDDPFCAFLGSDQTNLRQHIADAYPASGLALADGRICAASLADPVAVPFSDAALAGITAQHFQVWRPEVENTLAAEFHASRVVQQLNTRAGVPVTSEHVVTGAQHYSFLAPFPWRLRWVLPSAITRDAPDFDRARFQMQFAADVARFMSESFEHCDEAN